MGDFYMNYNIKKQPEILSEKHFRLIIERFLLKRLYEKEKISYSTFEKVKMEIDGEINYEKSSFNNLLKRINKEKETQK